MYMYITIITTLYLCYIILYYIISVAISGYSSSLPTHIRRVTLSNCTSDFTCRFLCMDAARDVEIEGGTWESRDSERLREVTGNR